jgi:hypothetical protein
VDLLLVDDLRPFAILAGFIVVLLALEIVLMLIGLSSQIEIDDIGTETDGLAELQEYSADFQDASLSPEEIAMLDLPLAGQPEQLALRRPPLVQRILRLAGIGQGPLLISLTCLAAGVSALGFMMQLALLGTLGWMLPAWPALAIVLVPGVLIGARLAAVAARLVPSFESHAISGQTYHGRRGQVVIGTAGRGDPAQVRWQDLYGTVHSLMAEPLRDSDRIPAGAKVLIVKTRERLPRIVMLAED